MNKRSSVIMLVLLLAPLCVDQRPVLADSALELLAGFDAPRVAATYPPSDAEKTGELAKLLYRLRKADTASLNEKASSGGDQVAIGDAIKISGRVQEVKVFAVPDKLVDFLEFKRFQQVTLDISKPNEEPNSLRVITTGLSNDVQKDDRVTGVGVILAIDDAPRATAVASGKLQWFPQQVQSVGWRILSEQGVDVSALADVNTRSRQPLMAADADAFYPMLAAAKKIGGSKVASPRTVKPLDLLQAPEKFSGEWLTMRVNTVRVTRVAVTDPVRQQQLGGDHYFQIDAMGNLGDVVIQIQRAPGETGEPIRFESTYPVSLVTPALPEFLAQQIRQQEGGDAAVAMIATPIRVDGFFFRLWSYSSDFMDRRGGGDQFGPLLVVANIVDIQSELVPGVGVEVIGYVSAAAIILGILAITIWSRITARGDDAERKKRRDREAEELQLPDQT